MIAVVQRVTKANVCIKGGYISGIKNGYMILLGCAKFDDEKDAQYIVKKIVGLRVFNDDDGKMNLSIKEINGSILLISQFTLLAQTRKGNRPSFTDAELPNRANELYEIVIAKLKEEKIQVQTGEFGETMEVSLTNDGPVTIILNSKDKKK